MVTDAGAGRLPPKEHISLSCSGHPRLKAHPVDLVAGLLCRETAVRALGGGAVIDDAGDFAGDRHGNVVPFGEFHDHAGRLDPFSDLIHRGDDLVYRLPPPRPRPPTAAGTAAAPTRGQQPP